MRRSMTAAMLLLPALGFVGNAYADCPDGVRPVSESEQQAYLALKQAIRAAIPPPPSGWSLKDPMAKMKQDAPKDVCKGGDPVPGWFGMTYVWEEQNKKNGARMKEQDDRIRKASAFTPEEQKEMDDLTRQARDLEYKARGAMKTNPDEAARFRAEAKPLSEKVGAVRKAHRERIAPELVAISKEYAADYVDPNVSVNIGVRDENPQRDVKEPLQIAGATIAYVNSQKEIVLVFGQKLPSSKESGGISAQPREVTATVRGDRPGAEIIAKLLGSTGLGEVGRK